MSIDEAIAASFPYELHEGLKPLLAHHLADIVLVYDADLAARTKPFLHIPEHGRHLPRSQIGFFAVEAQETREHVRIVVDQDMIVAFGKAHIRQIDVAECALAQFGAAEIDPFHLLLLRSIDFSLAANVAENNPAQLSLEGAIREGARSQNSRH